ncbi:MAG: multidrug effflux MFS transporter [Novosphingobium sp.]
MPSPERPARPLPTLGQREFVALLAMVQALQALAIDAMLPALGVMSSEFGVTDPNRRQLVISIFLLFSGLGSLFPGAAADRFGRKPVLLSCLAGYVVMMLFSALASDFTMMLIARAIAGLCASGLAVMPLAIIRDRFEGDRMARLQSLISVVFMVVPMLAPSLGQIVLLLVGWRWIFGLMAAIGMAVGVWAMLRLPETIHPEFRQPISPAAVAHNLWLAVTTRASIGYVFGAALIQGALFGYVNSAQQLVAEHFGAGSRFPLIFGAMALFMAGANFTNSRIVGRFGTRRVSQTALFAYIAIGLMQLWFASSGRETLWQFVPLTTLNMCMMGFIGANFAAIGLQPFARIAGSAASVQVFIRTVCAALLGMWIGQSYDGTAVPLAVGLVAAGFCSLALVLFSERGRLFRRVHYPGKPAPVPEN